MWCPELYEDDNEPEIPFAENNLKRYGIKELNSAPALNRNPNLHNHQTENTDFLCHPEATDFWYPELHEDLEDPEVVETVDKPLRRDYLKVNYFPKPNQYTKSVKDGPPVFVKSSPASTSSFNSEAENITPPFETVGLPVFDNPSVFAPPSSTNFNQDSGTTSTPLYNNQGL